MTDTEVSRYINAVHTKMWVLRHSGIDWKPEYGQMLEKANKELAEEELRRREHDRQRSRI